MKDAEGRTVVSGHAAVVVGLLWLLGSVVLGYLTSTSPEVGTLVQFMLGWAAVGALPALVLLLVLSRVE